MDNKDKLTIKQEKFAQNLFLGMSQRNAYKEAYTAGNMADKTIDERACVLAGKDKIIKRLDELIEEAKDKNQVTVQRVLDEMAAIAFSKATDYADVDDVDVIIDVNKETGKVTTKTVKVADIKKTKLLSETQQRAIQGIKQGVNGIEIRLHDKTKVLELMGRYLGMFVDKTITINVDADVKEYSKLNEKERKEYIDNLAKKAKNEE